MFAQKLQRDFNNIYKESDEHKFNFEMKADDIAPGGDGKWL